MPLRDPVPSSPSNSAQSIAIAWSDSPNVLLLQRPRRFDRIEVGRVRRKVANLDAAKGTLRSYASVVMSSEVVQDDDVPALELRKQFRCEPRDEPVLRGSRVHRG